jgi:excisionase family DNA binding protein
MPASTARKQRQEARPVDPWMSVREAARQLGIAPPTVLTRVIRGELEAQSTAGRTVISRASVERALAAGA